MRGTRGICMDGAPSLPWRRIVLDWWALSSFCPNIAQPPFYDAERAEELKWNVTGWNRDINEMSRLGGRGDFDAAKKFAVSSKNWMNPKVCPSLWKPPGIKTLCESQSRNSTGEGNWKEMEQDGGKPILKAHHWFQPHLEWPSCGWGQRRQTPSFRVCIFTAKFPVLQLNPLSWSSQRFLLVLLK